MPNATLYEILEVSPNASQTVITFAYRALCQRHHPDRNIGDQSAHEMMAKINIAYEVLSDPSRRAEYDMELEAQPLGATNSTDSMMTNADNDAIGDSAISENSKKRPMGMYISLIALLIVISFFFFDSYIESERQREAVESSKRAEETAQTIWSMAEAYLVGNGYPQNLKHALSIYEGLARDNRFSDGRAERRIAEFYFYGLGVDVDYARARQWYETANNKWKFGAIADPVPPFMLGIIYEEGLAVPKDKVMAYRYFNFSASARIYESHTNKLVTDRYKYAFGHDVTIKQLAAKKKEEFERKLSNEQIARAQQSM